MNRVFVDVGLYVKGHADIYMYSQLLSNYLVKNVAVLLQMLQNVAKCGPMAELVDALVLGTSIARCGSSSLLRPTKTVEIKQFFSFYIFHKNFISEFRLDWIAECLRSALHLGSSAARCEGSSPFRPTI